MLRVGGSLTNATWAILNLPFAATNVSGTLNRTAAACDSNTNGVSVLDLTNITWGSAFNPNATQYNVPQKIIDKIGGRPDGQATMVQPSGGFSQQGLASLFNSARSSTNSSTTPSATAAPTHHSSSHAGAIAGGVVGGVAGVALLAGLALFCLRRRRRSGAKRSDSPSERKDVPSLEIGGDVKAPPELSPETTYRGELSGNDGVYEKGDHDMWEKSRRVYGNGNEITVHDKGNGEVFEKDDGDGDGDGKTYRQDIAKRGELYGSDVNEMDGSTVAGGTERGNSARESRTETTQSPQSPR